MNSSDNVPDALVVTEMFPDAAPIFSHIVPSIVDVTDSCDVVLDTNVLLLPYTTGSNSLEAFRAVYERLRDADRLFVPAQVAREFARNRATKLAEIHKTLSDARSRLQKPSAHSYPLLDGLAEYRELKRRESALVEHIESYNDGLGELIAVIAGWGWNDPVARLYREMFTKRTIIECPRSDIEELQRRIAKKIPPGYKDAAKDDDGLGDLVIWLTILEICRTRERPLIFVTGDEKADWQQRIDNRGLLPRYELVDEFRRASNGEAFYIASFSRFLELFGVPSDVLEEVRVQEQPYIDELVANDAAAGQEDVSCPFCGQTNRIGLNATVGSSRQPICTACGSGFNAHRGPNGVFTRRPYSHGSLSPADPTGQRSESEVQVADCPFCSNPVAFGLRSEPGSSAIPNCGYCGRWFRAHRGGDGGVFVRVPGAGSSAPL